MDVNGTGVAVSLRSSPSSKYLPGSTFASRDPLRRDGTGDTQRVQPQLFSSPERRHPSSDNDRSARPSFYTADRERPSLREMRPYDRERDSGRVHENERTREQDRERERERRGSLSDHRRFDLDRRPFDNDRRPPPDGRRHPSYDRRPLLNDDRRLPHYEDKHPPGFVDRPVLDDRLPGYERRPSTEEVRMGNASFQDRPQEVLPENERRLGPNQPMKTRVPALSSAPPPRGVAVVMAPDPVDPAADGALAGDHRPTSSSSVSAVIDNQVISASYFTTSLGERSTQASSVHERISDTYDQLGPRTELTQPGLFPRERLAKPLEDTAPTPTSLPGTNQPDDDSPHTRVSEPSRAIDLRPGFNDDQKRFSLPAADNQTRSVSAAFPGALSVGRDESKFQPLPPPPPPRTSTPSAFSSGQSSLTLRAREPSRERPANLRPYLRSEFSRPPEDNRRLDTQPLQPSDGIRRYDERGRWSPPYGDRRSYREYYDRDRPYWDSKDRARDRPPQPHAPPPPHWDHERPRYPDPLYAGVGLDRRFEDRDQGNRARWYPPSYENSSRRQFDTFAARGRPRSPGSPSCDLPTPKRVRDDAYGGSHNTTGDNYYTHAYHPPAVSLNKEPLVPPPSSVPTPVPIPIPRPASPLSQPPRYNQNRPPSLEYGGTFGGYERDGGRGPAGPGYSREAPR